MSGLPLSHFPDSFILLILTGIILFTIFITEFIVRKNLIHKEISRKILHFTVISLSAYSVIIFNDFFLLKIAAGTAIVFTFTAVKLNWLKTVDNNDRKPWGIFFFPVCFLLLLLIFGKSGEWIIFIVLLQLAVADAAASITGIFFPYKSYQIINSTKTVSGSAAYFISSILVFFVYYAIYTEYQPVHSGNPGEIPFTLLNFMLIIGLPAIIITTITEAVTPGALDNLSVPVFGAVIMYSANLNSVDLLLITLIALLVGWISYKVKFLTLSGAVTTLLLTFFVLLIGKIQYAVPIFTFFVLSSLLSKIRKKANPEVEKYFDKTGTRDYGQVLANGGMPWIILFLSVFIRHELIYLIYAVSLAAVCADTWATEIGTMKPSRTYNILTFNLVKQGESGGVSILGTLGALLGSVVIAISTLVYPHYEIVYAILIIITGGLFGSFFDSFLGAKYQNRYKCSICGIITERSFHCSEPAEHFSGYKFLNNDLVNFLSAAAAAIFAIITYLIIL